GRGGAGADRCKSAQAAARLPTDWPATRQVEAQPRSDEGVTPLRVEKERATEFGRRGTGTTTIASDVESRWRWSGRRRCEHLIRDGHARTDQGVREARAAPQGQMDRLLDC